MSYEFNTQGGRFDLPNPHLTENIFLGLSGGLAILSGVISLMIGRSQLQTLSGESLAPILIAVGLFFFGALQIKALLVQLRFYFGRGQPASLAPVIDPNRQGTSDQAKELRECIRQNALIYETPRNPLDNLLYTLVPNLIYSPPRVQIYARMEFSTALAIAFLFTCYLISLLGITAQAREWVSALYLGLAGAVILWRRREGRVQGASLSIKKLVALAVSAVILPVLISIAVAKAQAVPSLPANFTLATFTILLSTLAASVLFLKATIAQTVHPNSIAMANSMEVVSMNADPATIFEEFSREMQRQWTEQVPNRTYIRVPPQLNGRSGPFAGEILEETQPIANSTESMTLSRAFGSPVYRWLAYLDAYAALACIVSFALLLVVARSGFAANPNSLVIALVLLVVGRYSFNAGNGLWKRFEFTSRVYWLELHGNFTRAQTNVGVTLTDVLKTEKEIVNVENMTLRMWVAEIDSMAFGADMLRTLSGMRGLPDVAASLGAQFSAYGRNQSSIVAPESEVDLKRLAMLNAMNPARNSMGISNAAAMAALSEQGKEN